jgi:hypothetical protein
MIQARDVVEQTETLSGGNRMSSQISARKNKCWRVPWALPQDNIQYAARPRMQRPDLDFRIRGNAGLPGLLIETHQMRPLFVQRQLLCRIICRTRD